MLESISIQNYALIDNLNIDLSSGLNVITGETGAGKSIIIDAISLLLGNRASKDNIRIGKNKMIVSGQFNVSDINDISDILSKYGVEIEDNILILTREVDKRGKNICRANGTIVPLTFFKELGNELIDIHSQHEHVSLFKPEHQRDLLDLYSGQEALNLLNEVSSLAVELRELAKQIKDLQVSSKEANRQHSVDLYQFNEISKANLEKDEEESLLEKEKALEKDEKLFNESSQTSMLLSGESDETPSITSQLSELSFQIKNLSKIDPFFNSYNEQIEQILGEFNSLSYDLTSYLDKLDFNPQELDQIHSRLSVIEDLKSKYGETIEDVLEYAKNLEEKINFYNNSDDLLKDSKNKYKLVRNDYNIKASKLSEERQKFSLLLKEELESELHDLAMDKAQVEIDIKTDSDLISKSGQDIINFLISVNPGIKPRELKKVASGGEISRIMLALKGIFGEKDKIGTMIFDEIDTGISGRTAQVVAEKIANLSSKRQIICITHLPQIAAMADNQFLVQKESDENSTQVTFNQLDENSRTLELARMLGGAEVTDLTRSSANEMLHQALILKQSFKN